MKEPELIIRAQERVEIVRKLLDVDIFRREMEIWLKSQESGTSKTKR